MNTTKITTPASDKIALRVRRLADRVTRIAEQKVQLAKAADARLEAKRLGKCGAVLALIAALSTTACTARWKDQCAEIGIPAGTPAFAQCVLIKEARFADSMNALATNLNALAIANTPQTYNVNVTYRRW